MTDLMTIQTTARLLITRSTEDDLTFDAEDLILYRTRSFSKTTQSYLTDLVRNAQRVAFANYFSNVLVGASNEGSETGDVGVWLGPGDYGKGKEENVLHTLGLSNSWLQTLKVQEESELVKEVNRSGLEGSTMRDQYCFSVEGGPYVFCFYIGEFEDGWGGLVAAGVWT